MPLAVKAPIAVTGAAAAKVVAALTCRVWLPPLLPKMVLPATAKLPATAAAPDMEVVPDASMMRRSTRGEAVPAAVVLKMRVPP